MLLFNVELTKAIEHCDQAILIATTLDDKTFKLKCLLRKTRAYILMSTSKKFCYLNEASETLAAGLEVAAELDWLAK